ncbi:MAG: UDP-glucose--hexose-1-phosphate uridylyltransferase [Spirochaetales bacterium]|nr:UDP-glucose--hexose-1-phosphate uridylyltransferase [Spirochaetales bacterium]
MNFLQAPHRRYNPLSGEWVLVSPHRAKRPWSGKTEDVSLFSRQQYDPGCYLCPGNTRANGEKNPQYTSTFTFINDFPALLPDTPGHESDDHFFFRAKSERGICKVICFSPRHDLTMALMETDQIKAVIELWQKEYNELGAREYINYVQIFENRGSIMGCSNMHPHCQIWSNENIPGLPEREHVTQKEYVLQKKSIMLLDYAEAELAADQRIIYRNDSFVALVPWWAVWPYETMIVPLAHRPSLAALSDKEMRDLASSMRHISVKYDNLFRTSFPYSMGFHQAPTNNQDNSHWQLHVHYFPPLLRSATVQKYMVGYELMANPQRDISAEQSAATLRALSAIHFTRTSQV